MMESFYKNRRLMEILWRLMADGGPGPIAVSASRGCDGVDVREGTRLLDISSCCSEPDAWEGEETSAFQTASHLLYLPPKADITLTPS